MGQGESRVRRHGSLAIHPDGRERCPGAWRHCKRRSRQVGSLSLIAVTWNHAPVPFIDRHQVHPGRTQRPRFQPLSPIPQPDLPASWIPDRRAPCAPGSEPWQPGFGGPCLPEIAHLSSSVEQRGHVASCAEQRGKPVRPRLSDDAPPTKALSQTQACAGLGLAPPVLLLASYNP